jgi:CoA:oxalate CoA-transferase
VTDSAPALPLTGVSVLDLGGPLSAYASKLLGDFGADVVKAEPPAGDELRTAPPLRAGESLLFSYYHSNKAGITLETGHPAAATLLGELAARADIILITPSVRRPLTGFDVDRRRVSWGPATAIVACLTPFGLSGPLSGWQMTPLTSFAMSGLMFKMGSASGPPVTVPARHGWDELGVHAVVAVLAALRDGTGQFIDLAVHDCLSAQDDVIQRYSVAQVIQARGQNPSYPPTGPWQCRDGRIEFQVHTDRHWAGFVEILGHPAELADPELAKRLVRVERQAQLRQQIADLLRVRSRHDLVRLGQAAGVPCGLLNTAAQFAADDQAAARGLFAVRPGTMREPVLPFHATAPLTRYRHPAPGLGEHNDQVYRQRLGHPASDLREWRRDGLI